MIPRLRAVSALVIFLIASGAAAGEKGLVLHWDFAEGEGTWLGDRSGTGNYGRIVGAKWVALTKGHGLAFDGVDDCVLAERAGSLVFGEGEFTIQVRFRPADVTKNAYLIGKWGTHEFMIHFGKGYGGNRMIMYLTSFKQYGYTGAEAIRKDTWTHITYVKSGEKLTCYVNGELSIGSQTAIPKSIPDSKTGLRLGGCKGYGFFNGLVREVRIYRRVLSAEEVYASYERIPAAAARPVALPETRAVGANELAVVVDGKAAAVIVIPQDADEWTRRAARWVRDYVEKSSGAALPLVTEDGAAKGTIISVGRTRMAAKAGVTADDLKYDGCRVVVKGDTLYLLGHDDPMGPNEWGGSNIGPKGTCRAATVFIEDVLGVRWYLPTPDGEIVPKHTTITVPRNLQKTFVPAFGFCHGRYPYGFGTPASIANNYRTAVKVLTMGGHSYYVWMNANKYFDKHPEYFALINGKRVKQGNHVCTSNPDVRRIMLGEIRKAFDAGWDWVALGQEDGYRRCQCPQCEKLDNFRDFAPYGWGPREGRTWDEYLATHRKTPCERLLLFHKWLADECRKSHPDKKLHMLLYVPTMFPSKKFDKFGDNVVGEMAFYHDRLDMEVLDWWKDKVHALTVMCTWFDLTGGSGMGMGVMMTPQEVARKIRGHHERNVVGIYGIHNANWGLQGASIYVQGKLVGDPSLNVNALITDYCNGLYGRAGRAMKDFFDILYSRSSRSMGIGAAGRLLSPAERHLIVYSPAFLQRLEPMLERAEVVARRDTRRVQRHVSLTRLHFDYLKLMTKMQASYQAWQANETAENFAELKETVDAFEDFRMKVIAEKDSSVTSFAGYDWFCKFLVGGGLDVNYYRRWVDRRKELDLGKLRGMVCGFSGSAVRKPITMDFLKARAKKKQAEMTVKRVPKGPKLDGVLSKDEWGHTDAKPLRPLTEGVRRVETRVRAVYDHESLYLAFECEEPEIEKMKLQAVGRDGNVWKLDHVEFFFDPEGSRRRRFQMMSAPHEDAAYDARIGFKTLNDEDIPWNSRWTYGFRIDKEKKVWTMEVAIPFQSLGISVPQDGGTLCANFGRARYAGGGHDPELYLWSHGETMGFSDPAAFGTLVFQHILY